MSGDPVHLLSERLANQAARAYVDGRFSDAAHGYATVLVMEPAYTTALFLLAMTRIAEGDHASARILMRRAAGMNGGSAAVSFLAGITEPVTGGTERAADLFGQAMTIHRLPWNPDVFRATLPNWVSFISITARGFPGAEGQAGRPAPTAYGTGTVDAACPVCGNRPAVRLFSVTAAQAAAHFMRSDFNMPLFPSLCAHITALWGGTECVIARCTACGFGFAHPYVAGDAYFYETTFGGALYPDDKWEFQVTREALRARRDAGRPVTALLEIGAGKGAFITSLVPELIAPQAVAFTEYNDAARDSLTAQGFVSLPPDVACQPPEGWRGRFDFR